MAKRKGREATNGNQRMRDLVDLATRAGWEVTRTKGNHLCFRSPDGAIVFGPQTPSDHRSALNVRSKLRHAGLDI